MNGVKLRSTKFSAQHQRGVALAIVVWFIAAMSLLVAGVVAAARTDVRYATLHREKAQVAAAGDGAINLFLADAVSGRFESAGVGSTSVSGGMYTVGDIQFRVLAIPVALHIDPRSANRDLLAELLRISGAVPADQIPAVADAVIQWRGGPAANGKRITVLEDMLEIPGINRAVLDVFADYVYVSRSNGRSGLAADNLRSRQALQLLQAVSPATRAAFGDPAANIPAEANKLASAPIRVDALATVDGRHWLRRKWVTLGGRQAGLPWRALQVDSARVVSKGAGA
ncbi:MAG: hypothetical protein AAF991_13530 [Pseudomonadota bacterium]